MCKYADDWEKKMQDHLDYCRRKNSLERRELRVGMGEKECDKVNAKEKEKKELEESQSRKSNDLLWCQKVIPEGYGGPGENEYYENPFEDPHYHERFSE